MDAKRQKIRDDIITLKERLDGYEDGTLQNRQLKKLGLRSEMVPFAANKLPQFEPCFFVPRDLQHPGILSLRYFNRHSSKEDEDKTLQLLRKQNTSVLPDRVQHPVILSTIHPDKLDDLKQEGFEVSSNTSLSSSGPLSKGKWPFSPDLRLSEHRYKFDSWRVYLSLEDTAHVAPHAIIDVLMNVKHPFCKLRVSEVRVILRVMEIRMDFPSYQEHLILPLLVISYLGSKYARLIQAHHDGTHMIVQYSSTVSLDDAWVRRLLGYYCSELVGMTIPK